ncbi:hypothetical protein JCM8097_005936 [Rhodosporidiobolus ruineniae]
MLAWLLWQFLGPIWYYHKWHLPYNVVEAFVANPDVSFARVTIIPLIELISNYNLFRSLVNLTGLLPWSLPRLLPSLFITALTTSRSMLLADTPAYPLKLLSDATPDWAHSVLQTVVNRARQVTLAWVKSTAVFCFVVYQVDGIMTISTIYPTIFLIGLLETVFYVSAAILLASIWATVYLETANVVFNSFKPKRRQHELRDLAAHDGQATRHFERLRSKFNHASLQPEVTLVLEDIVCPRWLALRNADDGYLSDYTEYWRQLSSVPSALPGVHSDVYKSAATSLISVLEEELSDRPPSRSIDPRSFRHRVAELAGIVLKYLLPFSSFKHLHRPFRLRAFLPFLVTYPGMRFIRTSTWNYQLSDQLLGGEAVAFTVALYNFLLASQRTQPALTKQQVSDALGGYLRMASARIEAVKAEEKAHEAILDAVLVWKARREDELTASRRPKAE